MATEMTSMQRALLSRLVTREAARRQHQGSSSEARQSSAGPSSATIEDAEAAWEREDGELGRMLEEERARNDVEWGQVRERLAALEHHLPDVEVKGGSSLTSKEVELAMLEHEIDDITISLDQLDPPQSDFVLSLKTRNVLSSSIGQYESALLLKQAELERERRLLQEDEKIWRQLESVREGLEARRARLIDKEVEERVEGGTIDTLQSKIEGVESSLSRLLASLISVSNSLYNEADGERREQLRHLIDRLINTAWDSPGNPWVQVNDQYQSSIVTFLVRANIAVEHPRDARSLRLVAFDS